ncbi:MAG TPA: hypothetical protein VIC25_03225, partial [Caulobacteraceae bacterium]
ARAATEAPGAPPKDEGAALTAARNAMPVDCNKPAAFDDGGDKIRSPDGQAFQAYLRGTQAFYVGDFDVAALRFASLRAARSPWLRETGLYMLARVEVNRMQAGVFDEYGAFKTPAPADATARTMGALATYLKAYPRGRYADSARGLTRRAWWLGGRIDKLAAVYAGLAAENPANRGVSDVDLANEIDNKLLGAAKVADLADPLLAAVIDLQQMRLPAEDDATAAAAKPPPPVDLESQRGKFAGHPALFDYLLAVRAFYRDHRPSEVLRLIPEDSGRSDLDTLAFSRQMLRGMALDATSDPKVRGVWLALAARASGPFQPAAVELAIAWHDERAGTLDKTFAAGSPVRGAAIRAILLSHAAGPDLLRRQAEAPGALPKEREVALFTLLYKELTRGRYGDYLKDVTLIPLAARIQPKDGDASSYSYAQSHDTWDQPTPLWTFVQPAGGAYACPTLSETAGRLMRGGEARARMCLAEWVRTYGYDGFYLDTPPGKAELGGAGHPFRGPVYSRLETYRQVIADPKAGSEDTAYALYRAVNCYGPSGNNHCGGIEAPPAQRKAWFQRLKTAYPSSPWSRKQKYVW